MVSVNCTDRTRHSTTFYILYFASYNTIASSITKQVFILIFIYTQQKQNNKETPRRVTSLTVQYAFQGRLLRTICYACQGISLRRRLSWSEYVYPMVNLTNVCLASLTMSLYSPALIVYVDFRNKKGFNAPPCGIKHLFSVSCLSTINIRMIHSLLQTYVH